mgnify:CR=1 FL=1
MICNRIINNCHRIVETISLEKATDFGYEKCYLETLPEMIVAQKLYQKLGFEYLCTPMGATGLTRLLWLHLFMEHQKKVETIPRGATGRW